MTIVSSQQIERNAADDVIAILETASVANCIREQEMLPNTASAVVVKCLNLRDALPDGTIPTGFRWADMSVEVMVHADDDTTGTTLAALLASVRTVIWDSGIVAALTAASSYHTYYALLAGDDLPDMDGRYRILALQFSLVLRPSKTV